MPPSEEPRREDKKRITITLNEKPLTLEEDAEPIRLLHVLEHSGIDFARLTRPVRMTVNGEEVGFQQLLREGDLVEIRCI